MGLLFIPIQSHSTADVGPNFGQCYSEAHMPIRMPATYIRQSVSIALMVFGLFAARGAYAQMLAGYWTFDDGSGKRSFSGTVHATTFGKAQYEWHPARRNGYAQPDGPAVDSTINADASAVFTLPAASLNVFRGQLGRE